MKDLVAANNAIIKASTPGFLAEVHAAQNALDIKHNRKEKPLKPKAKYGSKQGAINKVSVGLTKGLIFTHKGAGPGTRKAKPFFNPSADRYVQKLADDLAVSTGDTIAGNLCIK